METRCSRTTANENQKRYTLDEAIQLTGEHQNNDRK